MNNYFATYQPENFKSLLTDFHTYVDAILTKDAVDNPTLDWITETKADAQQPDPIKLVEERQLWKEFFPSEASEQAGVAIGDVKDRLSKSRSFKEFMFANENAETRTQVVHQFLDLIPREQYWFNKVGDLDKKLNNEQLAKLMTDKVSTSLPRTGLNVGVLPRADGGSKVDNPVTKHKANSIFSAASLGASTAQAFSSGPVDLGGVATKTATSGEIRETVEITQTVERPNVVRNSELKTDTKSEEAKLTEIRTRQQAQLRRAKINKSKQKADPKKAKAAGPFKKNAGVIAAATLGTGAVSGLPLFINLIT